MSCSRLLDENTRAFDLAVIKVTPHCWKRQSVWIQYNILVHKYCIIFLVIKMIGNALQFVVIVLLIPTEGTGVNKASQSNVIYNDFTS